MRIITYYINLVTISSMNNIINSNIPVKQPGMGMIIMVLTVEKIAAATLRVQVPKQYAKATPGQETGQVDRSSGFSDASLDIINGNLFQALKLMTKTQLK